MCSLHLMYCLYSVKAQVKVSVDVFSSLDVLFVFSQGIRRCVLFT